MRLAFLIFRYFPFGGLQRDCYQIAAECLVRGHQVHIYTMRWEGEPLAGATITILNPPGWTNAKRALNFSNQMQTILAEQNFDVVIGFNRMAGLDLYFAGDLCFVAQQSTKNLLFLHLSSRHKIYKKLEAAVFSPLAKTHILSLTKQSQVLYQHYYHTQSERFTQLLPLLQHTHVSSIDATRRNHLRAKFNIAPTDFLLVFISANFAIKGIDRAIMAVASLPEAVRSNVKLWIIGPDNPQRYLKQAQKLGIADLVCYLGPQIDVLDYLLAADLLIHPAKAELGGLVLLEALAAGLPILTTDVCGFAPNVAEYQAGIVLSSPFSQANLNQALATLLTPPVLSAYRTHAQLAAKEASQWQGHKQAVDVIESFYK